MRALLEQVKTQKKTRPRVTPDAAFAALAREAKGTCSADLVALLTFLTNHRLTRLGLWNVATAKEMTRPLRASTPWSDPAAIAAATATLFLGKDGSGWRIFALRSPDASDVFLHDTGTGQIALLATSIPAFVELNLVVEGWERFCEDEDIDPDPEAMGEIDPKHPRFAALRARAKALQGRVSLASRSDYDETVNALAKVKLRAKSASDVVGRFERAKRAALPLGVGAVNHARNRARSGDAS